MARSYDEPAKLVFRWHGDWRSRPYPADAAVRLLCDDVEIFSGLTDVPRPLASVEAHPAVEYAAHGRCRALDGPVAMTAEGGATIRLDPGALQAAVDAYLTHVAATLAAYKVEPTVDYIGGAEAVQTLPVTLEAGPARINR